MFPAYAIWKHIEGKILAHKFKQPHSALTCKADVCNGEFHCVAFLDDLAVEDDCKQRFVWFPDWLNEWMTYVV